MAFWAAMVAIVAIGSLSGVVKEALKSRSKGGGGRGLANELAEQRKAVESLRTELDALRKKVEEQEVFVDEAIAQFRPRLETLRQRGGQSNHRESDKET